jgi:hypothetical protein
MNPRDLEKLRESIGGGIFNEIKNNDGITDQMLKNFGKLSQLVSMGKILTNVSPTALSAVGGAAGLPPQVMAAIFASSLTKNVGNYKNQADIYQNLKLTNIAEKRLGYNNSFGDAGARAAYGTNSSLGALGSMAIAGKIAGTLGYVPDVLTNNHMLAAYGAMNGIRGSGMMAAGMMGGVKGLGTTIGSIGGSGTNPGYLAGIDPTMIGIATMMAMNMAGGKLNQAMVNLGTGKTSKYKLNTNMNFQHHSQIEAEYSSMLVIGSQIKVLQAMNAISPAETLISQILMMIESHTAPISGILQHLREQDEKREKLGGNAGQNVASDFFGEDGLMSLNDQGIGYKKQLNVFQKFFKGYAKFGMNLGSIFDIGGQLSNTLQGKSSVKLYNEFNRVEKDKNADQKFGNQMGISTQMVRIIHTSSSELLSHADTLESKKLTLMSGQFELQRFMSHELLSIRKDGLGVKRPGHAGELQKLRLQDEDQDGIFDNLGQMIDEMLGYIPLWQTISGSAKMLMGGVKNIHEFITSDESILGNIFRDIKNSITETFSMVDSDEGSLRNSIGATKLGPQELAYRYLSVGFIEHMQELIGINKDQAHYLEYLANNTASQVGASPLKKRRKSQALIMNQYTGNLSTRKDEYNYRQNLLDQLMDQVSGIQPNGFLGELFNTILPESTMRNMAAEYAFANYEHIGSMQSEFSNGMRRPRRFAKGGFTGKPKAGKNHGKSSGNNESIEGTVGANEVVLPEAHSLDSDLKSKINKNLPHGSTKIPETQSDKANVLLQEERDKATASAVIEQADNSKLSVKTEKGILEILQEWFNTYSKDREEKKKTSSGFNPFELIDDILKWALGGGMFAALLGGLSLLKNIPSILKKLDDVWNDVKDKTKKTLNRNGSNGPVHGPMTPEEYARKNKPETFSEKMKRWGTSGQEALNKGNEKVGTALKGAGKFMATGTVAAVAIGGLMAYVLEPDLDENGKQRSVMDKLQSVGKTLAGNTGAIIGGVMGAGLGGLIPLPGTSLVGMIAGSLIGDYAQDKIIEWWDNYGKAKPGDVGLNPTEKIQQMLLSNAGMLIGAGLGATVGFTSGGGYIGGAIGAILGGILGDKIQTKVMEISDAISKNGLFSEKAGAGLFEMAGLSAGAIAGRKVGMMAGATFGPIGALLGGIVGGMIGESLLSVGGKLIEIMNRDIDAPLVSQEKNKQIDAKIAMDKAKLKRDNLQTSRDKWVSGKDSFIATRKKAGKTEDEALSDYNTILKAWDNNLSLAENEWNSAQDNYALATGGLTGKDKDLHKRGLLRDSFESENIFSTKYVRETGTLEGNAKAFQQLKDGGMGAYGASQFDVKSGTLGAFLNHINFNSTGLNTEELAVINVIKKGGRTLTKKEREIFMGSHKIQSQVSNRAKQDEFAKTRFNRVLKDHKNIKAFYDAPNTNPTHKILKNYMVSQLNYLPEDGIAILNKILDDGEVTKDELLSLPAYMKKAATKRGFNYSGDQMDSVYVEKVNNQFTTEKDKIVVETIKKANNDKIKDTQKKIAEQKEKDKKQEALQKKQEDTYMEMINKLSQTNYELKQQTALANASAKLQQENIQLQAKLKEAQEFETIWSRHCSDRHYNENVSNIPLF